jgi:hypothetical protein
MSEREELARLIANQLDRLFLNRELEPAHQDYQLADALLAAGWRKPVRTVTSFEELDALGYGFVVRDDYGIVYAKPFNNGNFWLMVGDHEHHPAEHILLPATVLHEGEPS